MDETTILILLLIILVIIVYSFYFINIKKCKKKTKEKFTTTDTCSAGNGWKTGGDLFCGDDNAFVCFIRRLVCYIKDLTNKRANVNNCMTDAGVNCREKIAQNNPDKYCSADYGKKCTNSLNDGAGSCDDCDTNCPPNQYADKIRYGVAAKSCTMCPTGKTSTQDRKNCVSSNPGCDGVHNSGKTLDVCGVCDGDGSTCDGCDGVANSGKTNDACGVCDGDGSSCQGCDGVPNSGKTNDACGVCDGDGSSCSEQTSQVLTYDTAGAIPKINSPSEYICKAGFYQKYDADGNSLDECAYCPPNYYCPGEEVGQDNIVTDSGITRGAGLKVCPMRQNSEETVFGTAWTYDPYRTFTCGSDFDRNIDFWNVGYHEREGTSLKKNCSYDLLNGNSNFKFPRGGGAPDGTDSCAGQELGIEGLNYQCHLQTDEEDCLKLYNYQTDESRDTEILMNSKCSTDAQTFYTFNDNRERYCCPNSRQTGNDQTGTYTDSLLGGTCQL